MSNDMAIEVDIDTDAGMKTLRYDTAATVPAWVPASTSR